MSAIIHRSYCGCCGEVEVGDALWCDRCAGHVADTRRPWEGTYEAVTGQPCPYENGRSDDV